MTRSHHRVLCLAAVCVFLFSVAGLTACAEPMPTDNTTPEVNAAPEVGALAPDFTLPTVNGLSVTLSDYRGKPVMLNFWTTGCEPCRRHIPYLLEASEEMAKEGGLEFFTISRDDEATLRKFMQQEGYVFVVALDSDSAVWESYNISNTPNTFFIDSDGIIRSTHIGAFNDTAQVLSELEETGLTVPSTTAANAVPVPPTTAAKVVLEVGTPAPDFKLTTLNGQSVTLSDYRGKPVMLNFWATWCPYCRRQIPYLIEASDKMAKEGLEFFTVSREEEATIREFMQQEGYAFTVAVDSDNTTWESYHIGGIPHTFFIDSDGIIRSTHKGAFKDTSQVLDELQKIRADE